MTIPFRIIDTGLRDGRHQVALDQALIELHKAGRSPDTIRFVRFPPTVLLGRHQAVAQEIKQPYCRDNGVGLVRRITGGGAIYLDEGQIGWELLISRQRLPLPSLAAYTAAICTAVAHGLSRTFGIDARFRPRTDIEVDGRKLCGTSGYFDGDTLIYQGTVLVDVDPAHIYNCLNRPDPSLAESRLVTLKTLLGGHAPSLSQVYQSVLHGLIEQLALEPQPGRLSDEEEALAGLMLDAEIAKDSFIHEIDDPDGADMQHTRRATPGGNIAVHLRLNGEGPDAQILDALLTGDFLALPPRFVFDLQMALSGATVAEIPTIVDRVLATTPPEILTLSPRDLRDVIVAAALQPEGL